ncbi:hypothetical protein M8C21_004049, partial [Ambrosia artemisiifolia]
YEETYNSQLLEKEHSGCRTLLQDDKSTTWFYTLLVDLFPRIPFRFSKMFTTRHFSREITDNNRQRCWKKVCQIFKPYKNKIMQKTAINPYDRHDGGPQMLLTYSNKLAKYPI